MDEITPADALLSWSPPASDGGAPITNYVVEYRKVGDVRWTPVNGDTESLAEPSFKVPALMTETDYEFRVAAQNKAGTGPYSAPTKAKYGIIIVN